MNALLVAWRASRILPVSVTRGIAASFAWYGWASKAKPARRLEDNLHRVTGIEGKELRRPLWCSLSWDLSPHTALSPG